MIKGKGNYTGSRTISINPAITEAQIDQQTLIISDMKYVNKENKYKAVPTIVDAEGNVLKAGTDYNKDYQYVYADTGEMVGASIPAEGRIIRITVTGKGNYSGTISGTYQIAAETETTPFSKASVKIAAQAYTGQPVMPSGDRAPDGSGGDLTVKIGKTVL